MQMEDVWAARKGAENPDSEKGALPQRRPGAGQPRQEGGGSGRRGPWQPAAKEPQVPNQHSFAFVEIDGFSNKLRFPVQFDDLSF